METTVYYRRADGSYSERTVSGPDGTVITDPEGAVRVTRAQHAKALAEMSKEREAVRAAAGLAEREALAADYAALVAAGIPAKTARRLSGHTPDGNGPAPGGGLPVNAASLGVL